MLECTPLKPNGRHFQFSAFSTMPPSGRLPVSDLSLPLPPPVLPISYSQETATCPYRKEAPFPHKFSLEFFSWSQQI